MKKSEFDRLEYRVSLYKTLSSRQENFLRLKEYLCDPDMDFMFLSISGKRFRGEDFDVSCFREELKSLCDMQIIELAKEKNQL